MSAANQIDSASGSHPIETASVGACMNPIMHAAKSEQETERLGCGKPPQAQQINPHPPRLAPTEVNYCSSRVGHDTVLYSTHRTNPL